MNPNNIQTIIDKFDDFDAICPVCKSGIKQFLKDSLTSMLEVPYNVSEWKKIGIERGYWDYFEQQIIQSSANDVLKELDK